MKFSALWRYPLQYWKRRKSQKQAEIEARALRAKEKADNWEVVRKKMVKMKFDVWVTGTGGGGLRVGFKDDSWSEDPDRVRVYYICNGQIEGPLDWPRKYVFDIADSQKAIQFLLRETIRNNEEIFRIRRARALV